MNEFTEDELKDIELIYRTFCGDGRILTILEQNILIKLKNIVDNYCERDTRVVTTDENGHMLVMCGRCDFVFMV